jgi:hypothetical protein
LKKSEDISVDAIAATTNAIISKPLIDLFEVKIPE